jgi:hypothetical protein
MYVDGYGGQKSLGGDSAGGAKGGIIFVCPISGSIILKLYATLKEFPAILYQALQDVERQGFVCREIMVDTFVVNLSAAAEEVAAMFKTRIVPISAGTPQELAYAERAVRTVAEKSRSMLLGAPHLPNFMWGLSDTYAVFVIDVLPQPERGNKSPYFYRHKKEPNVDHLHIKVFGCPCQFAPIDGPEHKRASKTEWGYFVGMQWPMCLVYEPDTNQVISVSRKKIVCHEGMYADFDSKITKLPTATIQTMDPSKTMEDIKQSVVEESSQVKEADHEERIGAVHSIKVLRDHKSNESVNEALPSYQSRNLGEESRLDEDSLLAKIQEFKQQAKDNADSIP